MTLHEKIQTSDLSLVCKELATCNTKCQIKRGVWSASNNQDQQRWCKMQDGIEAEKNVERRDALLWEFLVDIIPLIKSILKKEAVMSQEWVDVDEEVNKFIEVLFVRCRKKLENTGVFKIRGLKGYLIFCIHNDLLGAAIKERERQERAVTYNSEYINALNRESVEVIDDDCYD